MTDYSKYFERKTRDNGEVFYCLTDDHPDWLYDAVRDAHGDEFPDDWSYDKIHSIFLSIEDGVDDAYEIADGLVDIYNGDRLRWLSGNLWRASACDEAAEELGSPNAGIYDRIGLGQYVWLADAAQTLLHAIAENEEEE